MQLHDSVDAIHEPIKQLLDLLYCQRLKRLELGALLCYRFCIGDRFYLHDNRILCEFDYAEQRSSLLTSAAGTTVSTAVSASTVSGAHVRIPSS